MLYKVECVSKSLKNLSLEIAHRNKQLDTVEQKRFNNNEVSCYSHVNCKKEWRKDFTPERLIT